MKTLNMTCDLCKSERPVHYWSTSCEEYNETVVAMNFGVSCGPNKHIMQLSVDICPQCFKDILIPWLESQGAVSNLEEISGAQV
jgi:hypothetical protein